MRLAAALISILLALPSFAQFHQQQRLDVKGIDRVMTSAMKAFGIPGAAVAIVRDDRVIHVAGYGTKELGGTEPVGPDTLFQIASTSKAFTSAAAAMLVDSGKLSWDDPVRKHVPYFRLSDRCADEEVTLRDLLSHRTGVARHDELWDGTPLTREQLLRSIGEVELSRPFRGGYQYQNIMFVAAGEVIGAAAGLPWDDFVRTRIFKPLGMTSTVLGDTEWNESDHATGYRYDWKSGRMMPQKPIETRTLGAAGAIKSSARDMASWLRFQLGDGAFEGTRLVGAAALAETKAPHTVIRMDDSSRDSNPDTNVMSYALGWNVQDYRGELLVAHAGALNGFRTHVDLLPRRNTGFVVMVNAGRGHAVMSIRNSLIDILTGKPPRDWNPYYLMVERKANEKEAREREDRLSRRVTGTVPTHPLAMYAGTYESPSHGQATVALSGDRLLLQWHHIAVPLTHFHYDVFNAEDPEAWLDEQVGFELGERKEVRAMRMFGSTFVRK